MNVYVLAAGYATRLLPLTARMPKALLEIGGAPMLDHLLRRVLQLDGLRRIVVVSNHRFAAHFHAWRETFASPVPVEILDDGSTTDENKLGAVGDLAFAAARVPPAGDDWMVVAGDNLLAFDLRPLHDEFRRRRRPVVVLREATPRPGPSPYNEVTLDDRSRIVRFREKPTDPSTGLTAIALYFFTPAVAALLRQYVTEGGNADAPGHFIAWLVDRTPVDGLRFDGAWFDVGTPASLDEARARFPHAGPAARGKAD